MDEQNYEFRCDDCNRRTAIILAVGDVLNPRAVLCGFCDSPRLRISAYYRNVEDLVYQLQTEVQEKARRIEILENGDDSPDDGVLDN